MLWNAQKLFAVIWRFKSNLACRITACFAVSETEESTEINSAQKDTKIMIIATSCCYKSCRENISFDVRTYLLLIKVVFAFETFKNEQAALDEPCSQRKDDYI